MSLSSEISAAMQRIAAEIKNMKIPATMSEMYVGLNNSKFITPASLKAFDVRIRRGGVYAGFVGSSNVAGTGSIWPNLLSARFGLTPVNYAVGGASYTGATDNFLIQMTRMRDAYTAAQRDEFRYIFVGDASNNARGNEAYGNVFNAARTLYTFAHVNFPNAELVILPMVWPSDTQKYAPAEIGGYQQVWNESCVRMMAAQRDAASFYVDTIFAEDSHTWLTNHDELMIATGNVHPNADGHALIARYMERILKGEQIMGYSTGWRAVDAKSGFVHGGRGARNLSVHREGWTVYYDGSMTSNAGFANPTDWANIPYGFRPTYLTVANNTRWSSNTNRVPVDIYPDGTIRVNDASGTSVGLHMSGSYKLG